MKKSAFINLLSTYKMKAYSNFHAEVRAEALSLIPPDLIFRLRGMTTAMAAMVQEHKDINRLLEGEEVIKALFHKDDYNASSPMRHTRIDETDFLDQTVTTIMYAIEHKEPYRTKMANIGKKFDEAIARAKKLNSTTALTELARLFDIPLDEDEVVSPDMKMTATIDVPFVKAEIKKAVMLA